MFQAAVASPHSLLRGFHVWIGIATGRAIAGRIGTRDQAKIGVFGPVMNVASRLEGLTKKIGASILLDHETLMAVRDALPPEEGRIRPTGSIQPSGFSHTVNVSELLPSEAESGISNGDVENFVDASIAFRNG
jgi:adenylate cyclase